MTVEVRPCRPEEVVHGLGPIFHFFGEAPSEQSVDNLSTLLTPERLFAAFEDGAAVGGAGSFPFELTVPGGRVRAGGITVVGVLPSHRRRGVLRELMRAQLDDLHERGEPVAYLWASESTIYGRFGYGMASLAGDINLMRDRSAYAHAFEPRGRVRLINRDEALDVIPPIYERVARETPGMFARTGEWWKRRALADPEWRRSGGGEMARAVVEVGGEAEAYALYRLHPAFEQFSSVGKTDVIEALGDSPAATAEIWRFLFDVDWMSRIEASLLPVDHPLFFLLAEPRRMRFMVTDALWVRLVDVGAALAARSYRGDGEVVLDVLDAFCPWNEGRWRVGGGGAERTDADPHLRLEIAALGSVYLGGFTFTELARASRLEELRPGALARADDLFRGDRAPWCVEIF
ncbi:MAG TPA: GNAT family N-acetyltransferase [Gaiellaceae bacterium]